MAATDAPQQAIGGTVAPYGGSIGYGGAWDVGAEHIPALVWPESVATYTRMRTDPVCASILAAYIGPLVAADWRINPSGADPTIVAICCDSLGLPLAGEKVDNIGALRRRGVKWVEFVRLACLHLVWGHIGFEPVYEIRDGKAYLKALPERMPSTIADIKINDDGTLKSIVQEGTGKGSTPNGVEIPADRLLWFCHNREGSNYTGTSLLRSCYSDWLLKLDSKRANAIGINRFGAGTPVAEPLPGTNPTTAQIAEAQRMVSAIRVGETGGAVPAGFKLRIIGVEGSLPDIVPTIQMHNQEMARGSLTSVLDLGNTSNGSRALGDTFSDMLKGAIQAVGDAMAEVATQLCERLTTFNAGEGANSPQVSCGDVGASKAAIVTAITGLVAAGIVTADEGLESYARDGYHLPPKDAAPVEAPAEPPTVPGAEDVTLAASGWQPWVMAAEGGADRNRGGAENFRRYWTEGPGAALIGYGTSGQFERCVAQLSKHMTPEQAKGYCAERIHEMTGEWPGAHRGKVHAAKSNFRASDLELPLPIPSLLAAAEGDPQPYREPTPQERAAGIDPAQVDEAQDGLVAEGMALFAAIVAVWGAALAAQITTSLAAGSLAGLARLRVDSTDAAQGLAVLMREAADAGVSHSLDEAGRAGVPAPSVAPEVDEAALDDAAAGIADLMGQGLASAAGREAARIAGPDSDPKTVARTAVATVTESDTPIHDAIQAGVTRAMGAGRAAAQAALMVGADLVPFHAGIRDRSQCGPCAEHDGTEYPSLAAAIADFPSGHYAACLGRSRCRCMIAVRPAVTS
jgi:hypothetical protein